MSRSRSVLNLKLNGVAPGPARLIRAVAGWVTGFTAFNRLYASLPDGATADLSRLFLERLSVRVETEGAYPEGIPANGPLLVVANHPFGLIEGMVIDVLLQAVRPDTTVMAVHWLMQIPEFAERLISVGPRHMQRRRGRSVAGLRQALAWLKQGHAMAVFPASHLERFRWDLGRVAEPDWSPHAANLIRRTGATTIPVHFRGHIGLGFLLLTAICPPLLNGLLIREFLNKRGKTLTAVWGLPIPPDHWPAEMSDDAVIAELQAKVAALGRTPAAA